MAGLGTETLPGGRALYLPLVAPRGIMGVLGLKPPAAATLADPEQLHLLETFANQTALAIERAMLAEEAQRAQVEVEAERLRSAFLSSVSHDLKTPLASITGAASSLLEGEQYIDPKSRRELIEGIHEEADRLNRVVSNVLDMSRLESGPITLRRDWHPLEEVVDAAIAGVHSRREKRVITRDLSPALPLVSIDGVLIGQVLANLLDNAIKYTPPDSSIRVSARPEEGGVLVEVADSGPGLPPGSEQRLFEKFYQAGPGGRRGGVGLGLAICRAIVDAHGGHIWAENRPEGGAVFRFTLPTRGAPPRMDDEDG